MATYFQRRARALRLEQSLVQRPVDENVPQDQFDSSQVPQGAYIDQIAQILQLDLSGATNPDQQGQMAVKAVQELVLKLHELSGMPESDDEMQAGEGEELGDQDQDVEDEYASDDEGDVPDEESDEESEDDPEMEESEDDFEDEDSDEPPQPPARMRRRRSMPLSLDYSEPVNRRLLQQVKGTRKQRILALSAQGLLTPFEAGQWIHKYCTNKSCGLALSHDNDPFDDAVALLTSSGRQMVFGEQSGPQNDIGVLGGDGKLLSLSADEIASPQKNALLRDADKRSEAKK